MMTQESKKPKSLAETLTERADDAAELQRKQKSRPRSEYIAEKIADYLDNKLSGDEMDSLYKNYGGAIESERLHREQAANEKKARAEARAEDLWNDRRKPTTEENAADKATIEEFCLRHPTWRRDIPTNVEKLLAHLRLNNELISTEALEAGYRELKLGGLFIESTEEEERVRRMSADSFLREHEELQDRRVPPLARAAVEKALISFASLRPEYLPTAKNATLMLGWLSETGLPPSTGNLDQAFNALGSQGFLELGDAVVSSGQTRFIDFGPRQPGYPSQPAKPSFRALVRDLTADELKQRMLDDKKFEAALDNLK
jgi:hypothetical protein